MDTHQQYSPLVIIGTCFYKLDTFFITAFPTPQGRLRPAPAAPTPKGAHRESIEIYMKYMIIL
jgi:hypothetical protein